MRPRQVRRLLALMWFGAVLIFAVALITLPKSYASPGQCGQGYAMGSGGGFCDGAPRADGHWYHCETVFVLGFGGTNCFWVHPVGTDVDPRGWQPD
jgi:hypothetical protein